jgi:hypothetical protein
MRMVTADRNLKFSARLGSVKTGHCDAPVSVSIPHKLLNETPPAT